MPTSPRTSYLLVAFVASAASAQDAGVLDELEPLDVIARRAEGLVGTGAADGGTPRTLKDYLGQPVVLYRLRCPECPELERTALIAPSALAESGVPVVLLLGGKGSTKKAAEKLLAKTSGNLRIAYGKKLTDAGGYRDVWFYGADGQPRTALNAFSDDDAWALQAAAEKLLVEAGAEAPKRKPRPRLGEPFPAALVEGLLGGAPDAGPSTLDGYLGQPHVIFFACPGCGGAADLEAFLPLVEPYRVPVVALVSHIRSTRADAEALAKQLGPRPGVRIGWGSELQPNVLRFSASTALVVDKHGVVRLAVPVSASERARGEWLLRAALERLQRER